MDDRAHGGNAVRRRETTIFWVAASSVSSPVAWGVVLGVEAHTPPVRPGFQGWETHLSIFRKGILTKGSATPSKNAGGRDRTRPGYQSPEQKINRRGVKPRLPHSTAIIAWRQQKERGLDQPAPRKMDEAARAPVRWRVWPSWNSRSKSKPTLSVLNWWALPRRQRRTASTGCAPGWSATMPATWPTCTARPMPGGTPRRCCRRCAASSWSA